MDAVRDEAVGGEVSGTRGFLRTKRADVSEACPSEGTHKGRTDKETRAITEAPTGEMEGGRSRRHTGMIQILMVLSRAEQCAVRSGRPKPGSSREGLSRQVVLGGRDDIKDQTAIRSEQHGEDQKRRSRIDFGVMELGSSTSGGGGSLQDRVRVSDRVRDLSETWGETAMR